MSRRSAQQRSAFGSDSFLDIIANIVGILIILIVIAGMRVSRAPSGAESPESSVPSPASSVQSSEPQAESEERRVESPQASTVTAQPSTAKLLRRIESLQAELAALKSTVQAASDEMDQLKTTKKQLAAELQSVSQKLAQEEKRLETASDQVASLRASINEAEDRLRRARKQLTRIENSPPKVETLRHRVTPISHKVTGKEIHFRLHGNRVAYVPLEELVDRLKSELGRKKDWLIRFNRYQGDVGPVEGFTLSYTLARQRLSVLEELNQGQGVVRIGVSEWKIQPDADPETESAEEALQPGSHFYRKLQTAVPGTTLTFWVYPDSYGLFRKLQQFAHQHRFRVAGRPLPFGVPIAGSPNGTRSAGQ